MAAQIVLYDRFGGPFERKQLKHANKAKAVAEAKRMLKGWKEADDRWVVHTDSRGALHVGIMSYGEYTDIAAAIMGLRGNGMRGNPSPASVPLSERPSRWKPVWWEYEGTEEQGTIRESGWQDPRLLDYVYVVGKRRTEYVPMWVAPEDRVRPRKSTGYLKSKRKNPSMREIMAKAMK